ncbi:serpentine type 7TM GPCR chemoreceptor srt domain-containing protein [Ditylenchus destructor]|nr:serpentine type 7TM GPCR chemoreceptor srt domain-containing protein [Ditylenchus destructor]
MDMYFFHYDEYELLYNCSFYNISMIPLEQRQHVGMGALFIALYFIFEILYIPCIIAIKKHTDSPCYKIMFYIGINDMICMCFNGFLTGYFAIMGTVFCSYPTFIYVCGNTALALWASETVAEVTLALNRCIAICSPKWEYILFKGYKTWIWMALPTIYAAYWWTFTKPILFSGIYMSWFFNPHVGYFDDFGLIYDNEVHITHNYFVIVGLTLTYSAFAIMLFVKSKKVAAGVVMISMINAVAAAVYVYMQFFRINQLIIYLGMVAWLLAHGIPPVIYLAMNKTLRRDAAKMLIHALQKAGPTVSSHHQSGHHGHHNAQHVTTITSNKQSSPTQPWSNNSTIGAGVH